MNKISCEICLDLMPLVIDGVASEDSKRLVEEHIKECEECRAIYSQPKKVEAVAVQIDNNKVLENIKRKLYSFAGLILLLGSIVGGSLSNSSNMFYNLIIMPILGVVSYLAFGKKAYIGSILVLIFSFINQAITGYLSGYFTNMKEVFYDASFMTGLYVVFFFIGIAIFKLLAIAIYGWKEGKNEKSY